MAPTNHTPSPPHPHGGPPHIHRAVHPCASACSDASCLVCGAMQPYTPIDWPICKQSCHMHQINLVCRQARTDHDRHRLEPQSNTKPTHNIHIVFLWAFGHAGNLAYIQDDGRADGKTDTRADTNSHTYLNIFTHNQTQQQTHTYRLVIMQAIIQQYRPPHRHHTIQTAVQTSTQAYKTATNHTGVHTASQTGLLVVQHVARADNHTSGHQTYRY